MNDEKSIKDYTIFLDFLSATAIDITQKVAGLELLPSERISMDASEVASFSVKTSGDFRMSLVLCAQLKVFQEIARHMKRQDEVTLGDIQIYSGEYFNIISGAFLSYVNNVQHTRTRFHIPCFSEGFYPAKSVDANNWTVLPYKCPYGALEFKICNLDE